MFDFSKQNGQGYSFKPWFWFPSHLICVLVDLAATGWSHLHLVHLQFPLYSAATGLFLTRPVTVPLELMLQIPAVYPSYCALGLGRWYSLCLECHLFPQHSLLPHTHPHSSPLSSSCFSVRLVLDITSLTWPSVSWDGYSFHIPKHSVFPHLSIYPTKL